MATNLKDTTVKYVNKDFESYKRDLMRYAQSHFSGSYQDYNEASPGMMIIELQAFIADNLAYYMDQQFLEVKQSTARQLANIEEFAKMRGYKPKGKRAARVDLYWMIEVPAINQNGKWIPGSPFGGALQPYDIVLRAGSQAGGPAGTTFETLEDLDFGTTSQENPQQLQIASWQSNGTDPKSYAVRRKVTSVAGKTVVDTIPVGDFVQYFRTQLGQSDVLEVVDISDSDGFNWYEVDYLSQNVIFDQVTNTGSDVGEVPYVMKARSAPRRFIVDTVVASSATFLQFGNGDGLKFDDELVPNIAQLSLPITGRKTFANFILDPQNFLKTRVLGLSPYNTTLTVRYRVGGGSQTNVPAQSISKALSADIVFGRIPGSPAESSAMNSVRSSAEVINIEPSVGGGEQESGSDIKVNADGYFAAQGRCVTKEDFVAHALTMPARFGRPEKVYTKPSEFNPMGVDLHVLSTDTDGHFSKPSPTLIQNMKTYLNRLRMVTEGITILPAYVVNFAINFGVVISPKFNRSEVLTNCMNTLKTYFANPNMQIGMPIVDSDVRAQLQNIKGVISVYKLEFSLKWGQPYAEDISLDFKSQTANGILYCPQDAIFELRYPDNDITGESK